MPDGRSLNQELVKILRSADIREKMAAEGVEAVGGTPQEYAAHIKAELASGDEKAIGLIGTVEQESALLASEDNDFLIRMGVSRKLLTEVMYRQKAVGEQGADRSTRRCLTRDETLRYNVANMR